ncbi:hypothetical protein T11_1763 [Trichinella zimbabwensis]|uniref:Uncharacterized protein n=1 Tax=Trichinella zimbabwensis TaxID=268475 RepID=A0A0V1DNQ8_9BILA|nr:hypothetical protein T11_1763 [Trichinella zimbabwensis]
MTSLALFLCALAVYMQLSAADRISVRKYEGTLGHSMVE